MSEPTDADRAKAREIALVAVDTILALEMHTPGASRISNVGLENYIAAALAAAREEERERCILAVEKAFLPPLYARDVVSAIRNGCDNA